MKFQNGFYLSICNHIWISGYNFVSLHPILNFNKMAKLTDKLREELKENDKSFFSVEVYETLDSDETMSGKVSMAGSFDTVVGMLLSVCENNPSMADIIVVTGGELLKGQIAKELEVKGLEDLTIKGEA